jgi:probable addiction module antidote protein
VISGGIVCLCGGDKSTQRKDIGARQSNDWKGRSRNMGLKLSELDISEYRDSEKVIAEFLTAALKDPNPEAFVSAIGHVAKARGMTSVAEKTGLGRESLYKAFAPGAKPRYETVIKILQSLGVKLQVVV